MINKLRKYPPALGEVELNYQIPPEKMQTCEKVLHQLRNAKDVSKFLLPLQNLYIQIKDLEEEQLDDIDVGLNKEIVEKVILNLNADKYNELEKNYTNILYD